MLEFHFHRFAWRKDLNQNALLFYNSLLILGPTLVLAFFTEDLTKVGDHRLSLVHACEWSRSAIMIDTGISDSSWRFFSHHWWASSWTIRRCYALIIIHHWPLQSLELAKFVPEAITLDLDWPLLFLCFSHRIYLSPTLVCSLVVTISFRSSILLDWISGKRSVGSR